jgi:hypothetical protein
MKVDWANYRHQVVALVAVIVEIAVIEDHVKVAKANNVKANKVNKASHVKEIGKRGEAIAIIAIADAAAAMDAMKDHKAMIVTKV